MKFNLNNFLSAISFLLDFSYEGIKYDTTNYSKRVAVIGNKIGTELGFGEEDLSDLASYNFLHHNGVLQAGMRREKSDQSVYDKRHCEIGEKNIKAFPLIKKRKNIILYHHEEYDGNGYFGKKGNETPLFSQIIALACFVESHYKKGINQDQQYEVAKLVMEERGKKFAPQLADIFVKLQSNTSFYLDLEDLFIDTVTRTELPGYNMKTEYTQLITMSKVIANIIDAKSTFMEGHSLSVADKIKQLSQFFEFDDNKTNRLMIAAYLHDIGKLAVPSEIINKKGRLTAEEFNIIKSHVYYTKRVLEQIEDFHDIAGWASNHHEKLNGKGYIFGYQKNQLDQESRILSVVGIYQALTEDRPYRAGMSHKNAVKVLMGMAQNQEVNLQTVKDVDRVFGVCCI